MKHCSRCDTWKDETDFTVNRATKSGLNSWCRKCTRENNINNYYRNRKDIIKRTGIYQKSENGKEVARRSQKTWIKNNPKKYITHQIVNQAVKYGILVPQPCLVCGEKNVVAHHKDYDRPYDVIWLCPQHHKDEHHKIDAVNSLQTK